ncbi:hypothetical protein DPMN_009076 [Dreissena polymorpha]|uniref:Uncharacterized protein n=1 Tax=Dreissena polymorpha TaxID=45954 RepID=A0A9D4N1N7_DREPO|nr:hypothetical protein DPMN_009076 [Dreissena polymorpha]
MATYPYTLCPQLIQTDIQIDRGIVVSRYGQGVINILTKFHKDWMKTVTSIVYTRFHQDILTKFHEDWMKSINILTKFHKDWMKTVTSTINILTKFHKDRMKTATSIVYTSDLINILTKFHEDRMKTATSIVYTSDLPAFIKINILTKFHKDWMKTATSIVYTRLDENCDLYCLHKQIVDGRTHTSTQTQRTPDITRSHKLTMSLRDR